MSETAAEKKRRGWIARHWGKATAVALALSAFLGWYETLHDQGRPLVCDLAGLVGQEEAIAICGEEEPTPDEANLLAQLEYLKAREAQLSPKRLEQLRRLETHFEERAFAMLMKAAALEEAPVDVQAEAAKHEAVRETVEEGDVEERRALAMIADGDVAGGLALLSGLASVSANEIVAQWRRIGRLAYAVDTALALDAYEKVIALDQADPWDAIYLGRLYTRVGSLADARRIFDDAIASLPKSEERDRGALLSEIGDVLVAQGDLSGALQSYRASMAIRERLAEADPNNAGWQRDLSVSYERIGDLEEARGDIVAAIAAYEDSLPIARFLADRLPDHPQFQSDVAITERRLTQLRARLD
jgi:tetratricopeptide (TPR) repeat protein